MSLPPSKTEQLATGCWCLFLLAASLTGYYWPSRISLAAWMTTRVRHVSSAQRCILKATASWTLWTLRKTRQLGLIFQGFLQLLLLRTCSTNQPVVNFGGAEERCALFLSKQQTDMSLKKKICWRIHFDCPQLDGCRLAFYTLISGCAENLKYNFSDNNFTSVVC